MTKSASKREHSQARLNYAKREQVQDDGVGLKRGRRLSTPSALRARPTGGQSVTTAKRYNHFLHLR